MFWSERARELLANEIRGKYDGIRVLEFWGFGVLEFCGFGVLEFWSIGVLEFWSFRVLEFWSLDMFLDMCLDMHNTKAMLVYVRSCGIFFIRK